MDTKQDNLEKNISRLVKLTGDSAEPGRAFTDSLIDSVLHELAESGGGGIQGGPFLGVNIDRVMRVAAMIAVVCGAGFEILLSGMVWVNTFFAAAISVTMVVNGLSYIGGLIL